MPFPQTLDAHPKVIFFTDFDGTISLKDTNDFMTDIYGFGPAKRREYTDETLEGRNSFRNTFQKMLDSWHLPFPEVIEIVKKNITLDPYFKDFMIWAREHEVPVVVLSSGLAPVIRELLGMLLSETGTEDIEIIANEPMPRAPVNNLEKADGWTINYHDDSDFGHDKSLTIRPYAEAIAKMPPSQRPTLLYAGDGVSDLSAARETDLLFAKTGNDLIIYCEREQIPFTPFENWSSILQETKDIYDGKKTVKKVAEEGLKRARTNSLEANGRVA